MEDGYGRPIRVRGELGVPGLSETGAVELVVESTNVHVLDNAYGEVAVTTNLQVLGSFAVPLVSGTITVTRGLIEMSDLLDRLASTGYRPVRTLGDTPNVEPSRYAQSSFSVTLALPDNLVVRGRDLRSGSGPIGLGDVNVTLGGALAVSKEVGEEPTIVGRVDVVRGQYRFQGRPFTIVRGSSLRFTGSATNPTLDVTAERRISGVTAEVDIAGTLAQPAIQLSSNPPLDQGDILSMIVFNQTMNQLPGSQRVSLAARAGALAAGAIATPIADSVARALDLDVFEIRPSDDVGGASVRIGRQVSDRLFLDFSQFFGRDEVSQFTFEYRLSEVLSVLTSWSHGSESTPGRRQAEQAGIDLILTVR
jgi:translocation and assembly module TamB